MERDYSVNALINFLEYAGRRGLLKQATASNLRGAVGRVAVVADANERADIRTIDPNAMYQRFENQHSGRYGPNSLREYKRRFEQALHEFKKYNESPSAYKPTIVSKSAAANRGLPKERTSTKLPQQGAPSANEAPKGVSAADPNYSGQMPPIPIPLRDGPPAIIQHLPVDLTIEEAERIAAIVRAYARTERKEG